jgi:hypothetical protein
MFSSSLVICLNYGPLFGFCSLKWLNVRAFAVKALLVS